jgi:hypothetical protein
MSSVNKASFSNEAEAGRNGGVDEEIADTV